MIVFTSIAANYIAKARILAKSLKENHNVIFVVCLLEREIPDMAKEISDFDYIVLAKDIGIKDFNNFIFKYSIIEAATAVKGQLCLYLLNRFPKENKFVYLDPDILILSKMTELEEAFEKNDLILIPHLTIPEKKRTKSQTAEAVINNEITVIKHGIFNLGFLAFKRSKESIKFLEWWKDRLNIFCYENISSGLFTDQKWIDLALCFFDIFILKHPGYDVAPWNLSMRKISKKNNKYYANNQPLRFFHFSGYNRFSYDLMLEKYSPNKKDPIHEIINDYSKKLTELKYDSINKFPWSYDYFKNNEKINKQARLIYKLLSEIKYFNEDPFNMSNEFFIKHPYILLNDTIFKNTSDQNNKIQQDSVYVENLKKDFDGMRNSICWKITKPIRIFGDMIGYKKSNLRY